MRELKFRAWIEDKDLNFKGMINGDELAFEDYAPLSDLLQDTETMKLMLYSGCKDTNGKDIYEGDILKTPFGHCEIFYRRACKDGAYYWGGNYQSSNVPLDHIPFSAFEIIGNIYENPELLKVN